MIKQDSRAYFRTLGEHIERLRKSRGMTQAEMARSIGVSQQAVYAYEVGDRRVSVLIVARLAKVFGISTDELIGMQWPERQPRSRLSPRAKRHAQRLEALTRSQQRFILRILDQLESSNKR